MVIDTDGSAFITKAEFDSLKNNFQAQIDGYNSSIDSKIDGAISAYLSGINISNSMTVEPDLNVKDYYWINNFSLTYTPDANPPAPQVLIWNGETKVFKPSKKVIHAFFATVPILWGDYWANVGSSMFFVGDIGAKDPVADGLDTSNRKSHGTTTISAANVWDADKITPGFVIMMKDVAGIKYPVLVRFSVLDIRASKDDTTGYGGSLLTWSYDLSRPPLGRGWNNSVFAIFGNEDNASSYVAIDLHSTEGLRLIPAPQGTKNNNGRVTWTTDKLMRLFAGQSTADWLIYSWPPNGDKTKFGRAYPGSLFHKRNHKSLLLGNSTDVDTEMTASFVTGAQEYNVDTFGVISGGSYTVDTVNNTETLSGDFYIKKIGTILHSNTNNGTTWKKAFDRSYDKDTNFTSLSFKCYTYKKIKDIYSSQSVDTGYNLKLPDGFPIYNAPQKGNAKFSIKINTTNDGTATTKVSFNNGRFTGNSSNMYKYNGETKLSDTLYELSPDANGEIFVETHVEAGDVIYVRLDPKDELAKNEAKVVDLSNLEIESLN